MYAYMYVYLYIYVCLEIVDFGLSDKMIKRSGKVDKSNYYNGFSGNISFFIHRRTSSDKIFFAFFYMLAIGVIDKIIEDVKRYKGRERVKDKRQVRKEQRGNRCRFDWFSIILSISSTKYYH